MGLVNSLIIAVVAALVPIGALFVGGQSLLNRHELSRFVREKQYEALEEAYNLYGRFMGLYRKINEGVEHGSPRPVPAWPASGELRRLLLEEAIDLEARVESMIIRIGSEFATADSREGLEPLLGNLRQSTQLWRESIVAGQHLPFYGSESRAYLRFKLSFADLCAYLAAETLSRSDPIKAQRGHARRLLRSSTSNKYEGDKATDQFLGEVLDPF